MKSVFRFFAACACIPLIWLLYSFSVHGVGGSFTIWNGVAYLIYFWLFAYYAISGRNPLATITKTRRKIVKKRTGEIKK